MQGTFGSAPQDPAGSHGRCMSRCPTTTSAWSYVDLRMPGWVALLIGRPGISPIPIARTLAAAARSRSSTPYANSGIRNP